MIRLSISEQGGAPRLVTFNQDQVTLGRTEQCDLRLGGQGISSAHCRIARTATGLQIEDLGSTNGTYVNRQRIGAAQAVTSADEIVIAMYRVQVFDDGRTSAPGVAAASPSMFAPSGTGIGGPTAAVPAQPAPIVPESGAQGMYRAGPPAAAAVPNAPATPAPTPGAEPAVDPVEAAWAREWEKIDSLCRSWLQSNRDNKRLLTGAKLKSARAWLTKGRGMRPPPKREHRDFIFASSRRRQLKIFGNVTLLGVVLGAVTVGGYVGYTRWMNAPDDDEETDDGEAADDSGGEEQIPPPKVDTLRASNGVAGIAEAEDDPVIATLLAIEALRLLPETDAARGAKAEQVFRDVVLKLRGRPLLGHNKQINAVAFTGDGRWAVTASDDDSARLWDLTGEATRSWFPLRGSGRVKAIAVSPDSKYIFTAGDTGKVIRRQLAKTGPKPEFPLHGLSVPATDAAVSDDGLWLAVGASSGTVALWDATAAAPRARKLTGHTAPIRAVDINADGTRVLAASADGFASAWRISGGAVGRRTKFTGHLGAVNDIALAPDESKVLTAAEDGAKLWNPSRGSGAIDLVLEEEVTRVAITPDSQLGITAGKSQVVQIWEIRSKTPAVGGIAFKGHEDAVLALDADGPTSPSDPRPTLALSGAADGTARTWNLDTRTTTVDSTVLGPHTDNVRAVAFSPDGHQVLTGDASGAAKIWDHETTAPAGAALVGARHRGPVTGVALNPSATRMVSVSADGRGIVWNLTRPGRLELIDALEGHTGSVKAVAVDPNGRWVATGDDGGQVRLWDLNKPKPGAKSITLKGHKRGITGLVFAPGGKRLLSLSSDSVHVWTLAAKPTSQKLGHKDELIAMSLSPDGGWLITGSVRQLVLWDLSAASIKESGKKLKRMHALDTLAVGVSKDAKWAASSGKDATLYMYDIEQKGKPKELLLHSKQVDVIAFSPDGKWMATGSRDNSIRLWDTTKDRPWANSTQLKGHSARIGVLHFSHDGKRLLSGSHDNTLRVWTIATGEAVVLAGHEKLVSGGAIADNGRVAVSGSYDKAVRLWPLTPHALIPIGCRATGRSFTQSEWERFFQDADYQPICDSR